MRSSLVLAILSASSLISLLGGCTKNYYKDVYVVKAASTDTATGDSGSADTGVETIPTAGPCALVDMADLPLNLWADGNTFRFTVSDQQRKAMDDLSANWDPYQLAISTYADDLLVTPVGSTDCASTGQIGLEITGQSSLRDWDHIPSLHMDLNDYNKDMTFPSGDVHLRLNNGQAESGIMREYVALKIWRALYAAPETAFGITQSNIWDADYGVGTQAPETVVQPYHSKFFQNNLPNVTDVFEVTGDFTHNTSLGEATCQWSSGTDCDMSKFDNLVAVLDAAPAGDGFRIATKDVIDWQKYFRYQCLVNITGTWDDYTHNLNNVVPAFGADGKMFILPYSTDISANHTWYPAIAYNNDFNGMAYIPNGCASDKGCYRAELQACLGVVEEFRALDAATTIVDAAWQSMTDLSIARDGDEENYKTIRDFYSEAADRVQTEVQTQLDCLNKPHRRGGHGGSSDACAGM